MNNIYRIEQDQGLGDAVALTIVLAHLRHYDPDCRIELMVRPGREALYEAPLVDVVYSRPFFEWQPTPFPKINWPLADASYAGHPSSFAERYLLSLGIEPIDELCRYRIPTPSAADRDYVRSFLPEHFQPLFPARIALLHYVGFSCPTQKNLDEVEAAAIVQSLEHAGYEVLILDQGSRSNLPERGLGRRVPIDALRRPVADPRTDRPLDAGLLAALIAEADLFVGVASGPLLVAAALQKTPVIGLWSELHPVHCIAPSDTASHLLRLPRGFKQPELAFLKPPADLGQAYFSMHYPRHFYCDDFASGLPALL